MSKYYRKVDIENGEPTLATDYALGQYDYARPVEVDDIPDVKERLQTLEQFHQKELQELRTHIANWSPHSICDPWHPASEPPKPEDFGEQDQILLLNNGRAFVINREYYHARAQDHSHWRRINPPK